jgi:hypothetical protein
VQKRLPLPLTARRIAWFAVTLDMRDVVEVRGSLQAIASLFDSFRDSPSGALRRLNDA